ncbi:MAG: tetratricopeptide repeat protein [Candidatus Eiseniibacteriota bacterium]
MRRLPIAISLALLGGCSPEGDDAVARGRRALEAGDPQEAFRILAPAVAGGTESAEARFHLAVAGARTLRISGAAASAARAAELAPEDAGAHMLKAVLDARRSLTLRARESAARAVQLAPDRPELRLAHAQILLVQGRQGTPEYAASQAELREALRRQPDDPRARFWLAKALVLGDEQEEGAKILDSLVDEGLEFGELLHLRGITRLRTRDFAGAAADCERALALGATDPAVHFNLSRAYARLGRHDDAEEQRRLHEVATKREEYVGGLWLSYSLESGDVAVATELGRVLTELERHDEAIPLLDSLCEDEPELSAPPPLLARAALDASRCETATRAAASAQELAPEDPEVLNLAAVVATECGAVDDAVPPAREAVRLVPEETEYRFTLLDALLDAGLVEEGARVLEEARALVNRHPRLDAARGRILRATGHPGEAVRALTAALDQRPRRHRWLYERALARLDGGDARGAEADLRAAIELAPLWIPPREALIGAVRAGGGHVGREEGELRDARRRIAAVAELRERVGRDPSDFARALELAGLLSDCGLAAEAGRVRARAFAWEPVA